MNNERKLRIVDDPHGRLWTADELKRNQPEVLESDLAEWLAARNFPAGIIIDIDGRTYMSYPLQDDQYDCLILKACEFIEGVWLLVGDGRALFPSFTNDRKAQREERRLNDSDVASDNPLTCTHEEIERMMQDEPLGRYGLRQYGEMRLFDERGI